MQLAIFFFFFCSCANPYQKGKSLFYKLYIMLQSTGGGEGESAEREITSLWQKIVALFDKNLISLPLLRYLCVKLGMNGKSRTTTNLPANTSV